MHLLVGKLRSLNADLTYRLGQRNAPGSEDGAQTGSHELLGRIDAMDAALKEYLSVTLGSIADMRDDLQDVARGTFVNAQEIAPDDSGSQTGGSRSLQAELDSASSPQEDARFSGKEVRCERKGNVHFANRPYLAPRMLPLLGL